MWDILIYSISSTVLPYYRNLQTWKITKQVFPLSNYFFKNELIRLRQHEKIYTSTILPLSTKILIPKIWCKRNWPELIVLWVFLYTFNRESICSLFLNTSINILQEDIWSNIEAHMYINHYQFFNVLYPLYFWIPLKIVLVLII